MRGLGRRLAAGIGATFAAMAFVTVATPAVSTADCDNSSWWDPVAGVCRPLEVPTAMNCENGWWDPVANVCRPPVAALDCENGAWWDPVSNVCRPPVVSLTPLGCENGSWWDPVANVCRPPLTG